MKAGTALDLALRDLGLDVVEVLGDAGGVELGGEVEGLGFGEAEGEQAPLEVGEGVVGDDVGGLGGERAGVGDGAEGLADGGTDGVGGSGGFVGGGLDHGEAELGDGAALALGLHLDADVRVAVDLLGGALEDLLVEVLVLGVQAVLDAEEAPPVVDGDPARGADLAEADAVLVEGEGVAGAEAGLDGEVDPGVDGGVGELAAERGRVDVAGRAGALDHLDLGEVGAPPPPLLAVGVEDVPLDADVCERAEGVLEVLPVVGVEVADAGEVAEGDLVALDAVVVQLLEGVEEEDVGDLALEEREGRLRVNRADVLLDLHGAGPCGVVEPEEERGLDGGSQLRWSFVGAAVAV